MTSPTIEAHPRTDDLDEFRCEVTAWLDARAARRTEDSSEAKRRLALSHQSVDDEAASVEESKTWQRRIYDAGFAGLAVPTEFGGQGLTAAHQQVWRDEVVKYALNMSRIGLGNILAVPTILAHGTDEQKERHIPPILRGETVWCQLFSEPGAGSDLAGLTTRAERDGDEWVVNGQKVWNSYAHIADWGLLLVRTDWDVPKHRGISYFLLDMRTPGVEARPLRQATGNAEFNETFLTDVRVPAENLVGGLNNGWAVAQTTLMNERAGIGGGAYGGLAWEDWAGLARSYGRHGDASIRQHLATLYTHQTLIALLGQRARSAARRGAGPGPESSVVKLLASLDLARRCDLAMAIQGADGMLSSTDAHEDGCWQQLFLGQWSPRIGGGTEQIQRNVLAERILGLPHEPRPDKTEPFRNVTRNG